MSWSTEAAFPVLLSFSFLIDPDIFSFVIHFLLLNVPNMHDAQIGTSFFKSIIFIEGIQVSLFLTYILCGGEIFFHDRILIHVI